MKKRHWVLREILYQNYETGMRFLTQKGVAERCKVSLGTVNSVVRRLEELGTIGKKPQGFRVRNGEKILQYWAGKRDLQKDLKYIAYTPQYPNEIEEKMPSDTIFTAYSGANRKIGSISTDYSEVYVYGDPDRVKGSFPGSKERKSFRGTEERKNIYVLEPDDHLKSISEDGIAPLVQIYADLWQLPPPADRFLREIKRALEEAVPGLEAIWGR